MNVSTVEAVGLHETRDPGCRNGHALQVVTGIGRGAGADDPARHPARILTCDRFAARHSIALGCDWPRRWLWCVGWRCGVSQLRPRRMLGSLVMMWPGSLRGAPEGSADGYRVLE